jgi:hypothetical protein
MTKTKKKKKPSPSLAELSTPDDFLKQQEPSKNFNQSPSRKFWLGRPLSR